MSQDSKELSSAFKRALAIAQAADKKVQADQATRKTVKVEMKVKGEREAEATIPAANKPVSPLFETKKTQDTNRTMTAQTSDLLPRILKSNGVESEIFLAKKTLPAEKVNDATIKSILQLLTSETNCTSFLLSSSAIVSPKHQLELLEALSRFGKRLTNLRLYGIKGIPLNVFKKLLQLPLLSLTFYECSVEGKNPTSDLTSLLSSCKTLKSFNACYLSLNETNLKTIIQMTNLERFYLLEKEEISIEKAEVFLKARWLRSLEIEHFSNESPQESKTEIQLVSNDKAKKRILDLLGNGKDLSLESFSSNHTLFRVAEIEQRITKITEEKRDVSSKKGGIIEDGRTTFMYEHTNSHLHKDIWKALNERNLEVLSKYISSREFSPNVFTDDHGCLDRNPFLNNLIANETHESLVIWMLDNFHAHINPNEYDHEWKNLLIIASKVYSADAIVLKLLQRFGKSLDLNAQDKEGRTAAHYLCAYGKLDLVKELVKFGADLKVTDFQGRTPADYAKMSEKEVSEILMSIDIDPARDAKAVMNNLVSFIYQLFTKHIADKGTTFQANLKTSQGWDINSLNSTLSNFELLSPSTHECAKKFKEEQAILRKHFCGKSVIQTCMANKPALVKFLETLKMGSSKPSR